METATRHNASSLPPPATPVVPEPASVAVLSAWPRSAQFAAMFLLGCLTTALGYQVIAGIRWVAEPTRIVEPQSLLYKVDLNQAPRSELVQLPGISATLADRIEDYRRLHGGFKDVDELARVPGIGPKTFEKVRPLVTVSNRTDVAAAKGVAPLPVAGGGKVAKLKEPVAINRATLAELQTLPGIGPKFSQRIIDEREKKQFTTVDDLRRVPGIGAKTLEKLRPYITIAP